MFHNFASTNIIEINKFVTQNLPQTKIDKAVFRYIINVFIYLFIQVKNLEKEIEEKDVQVREYKTLYDTSKENESRLTSLLESHKQQIIDLESRTGSYQSAVGRSEFTVSTLQEQNRQNADKIIELESRIRYESNVKLYTFVHIIDSTFNIQLQEGMFKRK